MVGDLGLGEIGCGLGGIHADEDVFLGAEIDGVLIEKIFAEIELVQGVAVEDPLDADLSDCRTDLGNGCADVGVSGQGSVEILQRAEGAARGIGE